MIAVDTQLLVHAHRRESPLHPQALNLLTGLARSGDAWAIPWPCVHEFLGTVTRAKLWKAPTPMPVALAAMEAWRSSAGLRFLHEAPDHFRRLASLLSAGRVVGPRVHDARVAAICLSYGVDPLWTIDRDFRAFPHLHSINPLAT